MDAILRPHQEYTDDVVVHSEDWDSQLLRFGGGAREPLGYRADSQSQKNAAWVCPKRNTWDAPWGIEKTRAIRDWLQPQTKRDV